MYRPQVGLIISGAGAQQHVRRSSLQCELKACLRDYDRKQGDIKLSCD